MASPFVVDGDTIALYHLNGVNVSTAGVDETGTWDFVENITGTGSITYNQSGWADDASLDPTDKATLHSSTPSNYGALYTANPSTVWFNSTITFLAVLKLSSSDAGNQRYSLGTNTASFATGWNLDNLLYHSLEWIRISWIDEDGVQRYKTLDVTGLGGRAAWQDTWLWLCSIWNPSRTNAHEMWCGILDTDSAPTISNAEGSANSKALKSDVSSDFFLGRSGSGLGGSLDTCSTVQIWDVDKGDAWVDEFYTAVKEWDGGGGGRRAALLNGVGRGVGRGMRKDSNCGLIERPTDREVINLSREHGKLAA